ncbi:MAG: hypothetical protein HGB34_00180 [Candidatus Moranbacteria bacterium]|nr:hypothetical protein [Candidatus Moranbacteria bacterium]
MKIEGKVNLREALGLSLERNFLNASAAFLADALKEINLGDDVTATFVDPEKGLHFWVKIKEREKDLLIVSVNCNGARGDYYPVVRRSFSGGHSGIGQIIESRYALEVIIREALGELTSKSL